MTHFTRRKLFATAAAATAATALTPLLGQAARAAAPAGKGTGVYRYKMGDYEIIQLMDGARTFPMPDHFVVNVSKDEAIKAAAAAYMPDGKVTIPFSPMLVNTGGKLVAIDTGNGLGANAATQGRSRPGPPQHGSGRHRSQASRYRHHLAFPRRPYRRPEERRRQSGVPERRDQGAGG